MYLLDLGLDYVRYVEQVSAALRLLPRAVAAVVGGDFLFAHVLLWVMGFGFSREREVDLIYGMEGREVIGKRCEGLFREFMVGMTRETLSSGRAKLIPHWNILSGWVS